MAFYIEDQRFEIANLRDDQDKKYDISVILWQTENIRADTSEVVLGSYIVPNTAHITGESSQLHGRMLKWTRTLC